VKEFVAEIQKDTACFQKLVKLSCQFVVKRKFDISYYDPDLQIVVAAITNTLSRWCEIYGS
jgi:hypothetical protein